MKILMISTVNLGANGISTFILNSAKILVKKSNDVTILAPNVVEKNLKANLLKQNIALKELPNRMSKPFKYFQALKKYLVQQKFDIIHVNGNSTTMAIELFAAKCANINLRIAHSHNTETEHPFINKVLRPLFEFSVNGRVACNKAAGHWLFKNKPFIIIPNGINVWNYQFNADKRRQYRNKLNINKNEVLLGHVGYFNYQKNQAFLIELLRTLPVKYKLILIGGGKDLSVIKAKTKEYNLNNRVIFAGIVSNVTDYLSAMDIFLLPSNFEGQPFVLIEAAASGLESIVSDKISKEINLTQNLTFISLNDLKNWKEKILDLSTTKKDRKRESLNNIRILSYKGYNIQRDVNKLMDYYEKKKSKKIH